MTAVVFRHEGMVNKFIGDAVLAVFGIPASRRSDAQQAVACARDMLVALSELNGWWTAKGHEPIQVGIGMHRGLVVHGNVGSDTRMEYTVIGDTVNAASRVAALNKELRFTILLTGEVADALGHSFPDLRRLGTRVLRGRTGETQLYTLTDGAAPSDR